VSSVWIYKVSNFINAHLSTNIFKIQGRTIKLITNKGRRDSCRQLFKQLQILPLPTQYMFSLLVFVNKNRELFLSNSAVHDMNTRNKHDLHLPTTNLTLAQKDSCTLEAKLLTAYHRISKLSQKMLNFSKLHLSVTN